MRGDLRQKYKRARIVMAVVSAPAITVWVVRTGPIGFWVSQKGDTGEEKGGGNRAGLVLVMGRGAKGWDEERTYGSEEGTQ